MPIIPNKQDLEIQALADLKEHQEKKVSLLLTFPEAWILFGMIQLSLRHPMIPETSKDATYKIAKGLQNMITVTPALVLLADLGWDPDYDYFPEDHPENE